MNHKLKYNTAKIVPVMKRTVLLVVLLVLCPVFLAGSAERKKVDPWVPMAERVRIWDEVVAKDLGLTLPLKEPKPYAVSSNGLEATFEKDGVQWTIIGAAWQNAKSTVYPKTWPVKGNDFEVHVIPDPITNYKILPFTEKIENAVKSDVISITAARDSYEAASFVIRSGDVDLKDLQIVISDLKAEVEEHGTTKTALITKHDVNVRVVKCWYQAGTSYWDITHKVLTPELLLHDDGLVEVDYDHQVNLLREAKKIQDSEQLELFNVAKNQNKQIWLTIHIKDSIPPGKYHGFINIIIGGTKKKILKLEINVLPFVLPEPMLDYALYYDGYISDKKGLFEAGNAKTTDQMFCELIDMKEHGLTNATTRHNVAEDKGKWSEALEALNQVLELRERVGWGKKPLLYVDWSRRFIGDLKVYKAKVESIVKQSRSFGIQDVYIYGVDEKKGMELFNLRPAYKVVHDAGAKNFVACREDFLIYVPDLLDLPILAGQPNQFFMRVLNRLGINAWNYANPQTGFEEPETYRKNYGIRLFINGFAGVCDFIYQGGYPWSEIVDNKMRSHTMAYPTVNRPIPTIQWEGWREGVNDIRYITLLRNNQMLNDDWLKEQCLDNANKCREKTIERLLCSEHIK